MISPIKLISQTFSKDLSSADSSFFLGNVGDRLEIDTIFSVENYVISTLDDPFILNNTNGTIGTGWVFDPLGGFANFKVGDTIYCYNKNLATGESKTILSKIDDSNIQVAAFGCPNDTSFESFVISNTTPITAIKFRYNFIENDAADSFLSHFDGSDQLIICPSKLASDTGFTIMTFTGGKEWQSGIASIQGVSIDDGTTDGVYKSRYKILHFVKVPPFILPEQIDNQKSGIYPSYFKDSKCWKYITQISAAELITNPNFLVSQNFSETLGNSGWYGENYNTGKTNYSISNLVYNNSGVVDSIQLSTIETIITFDVLNTADTPFSNNNTKFILGIFKVPVDPSEYQNNGKLLFDNFLFDRAMPTVGGAAVNGDNYGGTYQFLKGISAVYVSSSKITVTAKIDMSAATLAGFQASSLPQYFMFLSTQNYLLDTLDPLNDLVSLPIDLNTFTFVTADPTMIQVSNVFLRHPESDPATQGFIPGVSTPATGTVTQYPSASGAYLVIDEINGKTIGVADDAGSLLATINVLVNSINTNTPLGTIFGGWPAFDNSAGWTASASISVGFGGYRFTLTSPSGSIYNGLTITTKGDAGDSTPSTLAGGSDTGSGGVFNVFPQDEIVACSNFYIESLARDADEIKISSVIPKIIANDGAKEFDIDSYVLQLSPYPLIGYTQQFDVQIARAFHVPVGTIRKYIEVKRRNDLDSGTKKFFSLNYPFLFRWETWTAALGVDSSFFDSTLPNNGFNEWWFHYKTGSWKIYYKLIVNATKNGIAQQYELQQEINPNDYNSNTDYTIADTYAFNPEDLDLLLSGTGGAIQLVTGNTTSITVNGQIYATNGENMANTYKKTLLAIVFKKTTTPVDVTVEIDVEIFEKGGIYGKRRYSSRWAADSDTWFSSIDGSDTIVLYAYGDYIIALCYFDPATLNFPTTAKSFSFSPRIYEIAMPLNLQTNDGIDILTNDGVEEIIN